MRITQLILCTIILACSLSCKNNPTKIDRKIVVRNYCTEIGRFDLTFYEDEISGSYVLLPKKSLGAIWGKLENLEMKGVWIDEDGKGVIIINFNQDFSSFSTSYSNDEHPEKWYTNSWTGYLRPNSDAGFSINGKEYQCE